MSFEPPNERAFNPLVWQIVRQIPEGKVSTYGQIASMIPTPESVNPLSYIRVRARWVGSALRHAVDGTVPWHRVINSKGTISNLPQPGAREEQRRRLEEEGIEFDEDERVDFEAYGWEGPDIAWLEANDLLPPRPLP